MMSEYVVVGNIRFYEVEGMICTGNSNQSIPKNALERDVKGPLRIPESIDFRETRRNVELIGNCSFQQCLATIVFIPRFVKEIRRDSFIYCPYLREVIFAENSKLYLIGRGSFFKMKKLKNIWIPGNVSIVQYEAFGPYSITDVYYCGSNLVYADVFTLSELKETIRIHVTSEYPFDKFGKLNITDISYGCYFKPYKEIIVSRCVRRRSTSNTFSLFLVISFS